MRPILIVDDEKDLLEILRDILELHGFPVVTAADGQAALDYLHSATETPALIFLDLTMPVMNGFRFLELLHGSDELRSLRIPVVIISAVHEFIPLEQFGCAGVLRKPAAMEKIVAMANRFVQPEQQHTQRDM